MASGHTEHYQLNQWSLDDPVQMEDFNEDNRKVDEALNQLMSERVRMTLGSYIGTGEYGPEHPNTLTFDFTPRLLLILGEGHGGSFLLTYSAITTYAPPTATSDSWELEFQWTDNSISWYSEERPGTQRNAEGVAYTYLVIGEQ